MQSEIGYYFFAFLNRKEALVYSFVSFVQISLPLLQTQTVSLRYYELVAGIYELVSVCILLAGIYLIFFRGRNASIMDFCSEADCAYTL